VLGVTGRDVAVGADGAEVGGIGAAVAVGWATGALVGVETTIVTPIGRGGSCAGADVAVGRGGGDVAVAARAGGCVGAGRGGAGAWVAAGR
jgi:hypothetical protein